MSLINIRRKYKHFFHIEAVFAVVVITILSACTSNRAQLEGNEANVIFTIDTNIKYQYVRGFGGMDVGWENFPQTSARDAELMFNPDTGLGLNILRIMIMPWNTDISETMNTLITGARPDYYENVKIVNRHGGYVLASPWTPPAVWKSNNSNTTQGNGRLLRAHYQDYANYLRAFAMNMYENGAPIYAVSIQNEPNYEVDYDGCLWSPQEMRDFFLQVGRFTEGVRGFGGGRQIPSVLTMNGESANHPNINDAALDNPQSRAVIDLIGRHTYGNRLNRYVKAIEHPTAPREVWMTENNMNSGNANGYPSDSTWDYVWKILNDIDLSIRLNDESAYIWWAAKRFYSFIGDGQWGTIEGEILPRGYAISHYAKFAKETYRVAVFADGETSDGSYVTSRNFNTMSDNVDGTAARATAFVSPNGRTITVVMFTPTTTDGTGGVDMGNVRIQLPANFRIREATAMRTSEGSFAQMETVQIAPNRNSAVVSLPRGNILSVRFKR